MVVCLNDVVYKPVRRNRRSTHYRGESHVVIEAVDDADRDREVDEPMMLPTHAIVGLAIATPLAMLAPDLAPAALAGGLFGGVFPDLDLYSGHRKTLHFPTGYLLAVLPAVGLAALAPRAV